ncbi:MAG: hypothetical protein QM831_12670 [Kofleriaceae bacterium]
MSVATGIRSFRAAADRLPSSAEATSIAIASSLSKFPPKNQEPGTYVQGSWRSGRDSKAQEDQDLSVTGCDGVTSSNIDVDVGPHGVDQPRNESSRSDTIGGLLAAAMLAWFNDRDAKAMRRVLLELLLALEQL